MNFVLESLPTDKLTTPYFENFQNFTNFCKYTPLNNNSIGVKTVCVCEIGEEPVITLRRREVQTQTEWTRNNTFTKNYCRHSTVEPLYVRDKH